MTEDRIITEFDGMKLSEVSDYIEDLYRKIKSHGGDVETAKFYYDYSHRDEDEYTLLLFFEREETASEKNLPF